MKPRKRIKKKNTCVLKLRVSRSPKLEPCFRCLPVLPCRRLGYRSPWRESLALAVAPAAPAETEGHAPAAAPAPAVVAHVHARAVRRRVGRVALLNKNGHPARHARRVVHPRRPRRRRHRCRGRNTPHHAHGSHASPAPYMYTTMPRVTHRVFALVYMGLTGKRGHENEAEHARARRSHSNTS